MEASDRRARAAEEAAQWWVTMQDEPTREERERFVDWLRESALHVAEMLRVAQVHDALEQFNRWMQLPVEAAVANRSNVVALPAVAVSPPARSQSQSAGKAAVFTPRWALAAAAILALMGGLWWLSGSRAQIISTERGERREIALSDGSVVQVDPQTRLLVTYGTHSRRVVLEQGRALFHVAKNAERPFLVQARQTTVRAVGTAFAVERDPESIIVTVSEGKVAVSAPEVGSAPTVTDAAGGATPMPTPATGHAGVVSSAPRTDGRTGAAGQIYLTASEQVTIESTGAAKAIQHVDTERVLAWASGRLVFNNDTVEYVVSQFNRYNRIQLSVSDTKLARRQITGVFDAAEPESFVAFIQTVAPVRISRSSAADISIDAAN